MDQFNESLYQDLFRKAIGGDKEALNQFFTLLRSEMHAISKGMIPDSMKQKFDSSDLVQSTLREAFEGFKSFRGMTVGEFWSWLSAIQRNNAKSAVLKYRAKSRNVDDEIPIDQVKPIYVEQSPEQQLQEEESRALQQRAFQELSPEDRQILTMRHINKSSYEEIAQSLGESPATIRKRYSRAMIRWADKLEKVLPKEGEEG